jgi:hypothetical protein
VNRDRAYTGTLGTTVMDDDRVTGALHDRGRPEDVQAELGAVAKPISLHR